MLDYRSGGEANGGEKMAQLNIYRDKYDGNVYETQNDYVYKWISDYHDIYDSRVKLNYQLVTQSETIYDFRPVYETKTIEKEHIEWETQTVWKTEAILGTQEQTLTETKYQQTTGRGGEYADSLFAKNLFIKQTLVQIYRKYLWNRYNRYLC
jgi:hypothetical protein